MMVTRVHTPEDPCLRRVLDAYMQFRTDWMKDHDSFIEPTFEEFLRDFQVAYEAERNVDYCDIA